MERTYTIEEIRSAFWGKFHESGEAWFPYWRGESRQNNIETEMQWLEFAKELEQGNDPHVAIEKV